MLAHPRRLLVAALVLAACRAAPAAASDLLAAFPLEEGAGAVVSDRSGHGFKGAVRGGTWTRDPQFGAVLSLRRGGCVEIPDAAGLTPGADATFEAWVKLADAPTDLSALVAKWGGIDDEYMMFVSAGRNLGFAWRTIGGGAAGGMQWGAPNWSWANDARALPLSRWTHVAVVRSGSELALYVNGEASTALSVPGRFGDATPFVGADDQPFRRGRNPLRLGAQAPGQKSLSGALSGVRIYGRALSAAEIRADLRATNRALRARR